LPDVNLAREVLWVDTGRRIPHLVRSHWLEVRRRFHALGMARNLFRRKSRPAVQAALRER
jgi:hypothetical protein